MRYRATVGSVRSRRAAEAEERRDRIVLAAMQHFAQHGFRGTRVEDIAHDVGVAKGTVFLDFGSKEGLFLAAYQTAVRSLPAWLDAPEDVVQPVPSAAATAQVASTPAVASTPNIASAPSPAAPESRCYGPDSIWRTP